MALQPYTKKTYLNSNPKWIAPGGISALKDCDSMVLDRSLFDFVTNFPNGYIPSGVLLGEVTATPGVVGPYSGLTLEVQTLTQGGSGLTSFTLTYGGQTTASILQAATGADVKAALVLLPNINEEDIEVSGPSGGPYIVTFKRALAGENIAQFTTTPTGGSGTVTPATTTQGGTAGSTEGRQHPVGFLRHDVAIDSANAASADELVAVYWHGEVDVSELPANSGFDENARADLAAKFRFI